MHSPAPCLSLSPYRAVSGTGMNDPRTRIRLIRWNNSPPRASRTKCQNDVRSMRVSANILFAVTIYILTLYGKLLEKQIFPKPRERYFNHDAADTFHRASTTKCLFATENVTRHLLFLFPSLFSYTYIIYNDFFENVSKDRDVLR